MDLTIIATMLELIWLMLIRILMDFTHSFKMFNLKTLNLAYMSHKRVEYNMVRFIILPMSKMLNNMKKLESKMLMEIIMFPFIFSLMLKQLEMINPKRLKVMLLLSNPVREMKYHILKPQKKNSASLNPLNKKNKSQKKNKRKKLVDLPKLKKLMKAHLKRKKKVNNNNKKRSKLKLLKMKRNKILMMHLEKSNLKNNKKVRVSI